MTAASKILMGSGASGAAGPSVAISPAWAGKTTWVFADDGALNIGTAGVYVITPSEDITVDIEMWGGAGSAGWIYNSSTATSTNIGPGGGGGFATGRLVLKSGVEYVLHIGEGGAALPGTSGTSTRSNADYRAGGIMTTFGTQAGGYSGIFKTSTISQATARLIAGGGGCGGDSAYGQGGAGGGANGQNSTSAGNQGGSGGTQAAGGAPAIHGGGAQYGSALLGGRGHNYAGRLSGGGGGGYFGGGGMHVGGGGGGAGYFDSSDSDLTLETITTGALNVPGNSGGTNRGGSGDGGATAAAYGGDGRIYMTEV
tara:strand:- start:743 stop:1678 length:936 start_codon:yes stop_codon:yes gene_type:complete